MQAKIQMGVHDKKESVGLLAFKIRTLDVEESHSCFAPRNSPLEAALISYF
jgi:hypothetical protein